MPTSRKDKKIPFAHDSRHFHSSGISMHSMDTPPSPNIPLPGPYSYATSYASSIPRPHPLLEASAVSWNMMKHSSAVTRNRHPLPGRALHEPATAPPQPFLSISSVHLPWIIDVFPSNGSYVSVGDVLDTIYISLRTNITDTEFHFFPHWAERVRATRAYEERYRKYRNTFGNESEKQCGMKRIDFLMNHTKFHGIICKSGQHPDKWQLNVLPLNALDTNSRQSFPTHQGSMLHASHRG